MHYDGSGCVWSGVGVRVGVAEGLGIVLGLVNRSRATNNSQLLMISIILFT